MRMNNFANQNRRYEGSSTENPTRTEGDNAQQKRLASPIARISDKEVCCRRRDEIHGRPQHEICVDRLSLVVLPWLGWNSPFLSTSLPTGRAMADLLRRSLWNR